MPILVHYGGVLDSSEVEGAGMWYGRLPHQCACGRGIQSQPLQWKGHVVSGFARDSVDSLT
jgi:hypothetical protein